MDVQLGNARAAKLGILSGLAWGMILAGCLINVKDVTRAIGLAIAIFGFVILIVVTAPQWVPNMVRESIIEKAGGGTVDDEDDEP